MTQKMMWNIAIKGSMVLGLCLSAALSGFFRTGKADASYIIEKKCMSAQSKKKALSKRKQVCSCVIENLQSKLTSAQMQDLEGIYKDRGSRIAASRDKTRRMLVDIDHEVSKNCAVNPEWVFPRDDLGEPDPL